MISSLLAMLTQTTPPESGGVSDYLPVFIALAVVGVLLVFVMLIVKRYKRCPSNRVLVVYGKVGAGTSARCLHGGGAFIWPVLQNYAYLSLDPIQIEVPLRGALSVENIRVNVPSVFTVAIATDEATMTNAAIRLLGLDTREIMKQAEDIIFGQLRQVIASMKIEDINRDRDAFLSSIQTSLEPELQKIGLVLINVNITDITDESGYIEAIGRKAASEAVQQAEIDVAIQQKKGAIGVAQALKERAIDVANFNKLQEMGTKEAERDKFVRIAELEKERTVGEQSAAYQRESQVKEAERNMRIQVADANAKAVVGENQSKAEIAEADATLQVKQAEAYQLGETRKREADARVREAQYIAEAKAAESLGVKIEQETRAELESKARAEKAKQIVDAEADAAQKTIDAEATATATFAKLEAQARGEYEILAKKGEGLKRIVDGCGGPQAAFQLLMIEKLDGLSQNAAKAISNIKFDKVIVWDGGNGEGGTAGFLKGLAGALPPMLNMMKDIGGVEMPEFFGRLAKDHTENSEPAPDGETVKAEPAKDGGDTAKHAQKPATGGAGNSGRKRRGPPEAPR